MIGKEEDELMELLWYSQLISLMNNMWLVSDPWPPYFLPIFAFPWSSFSVVVPLSKQTGFKDMLCVLSSYLILLPDISVAPGELQVENIKWKITALNSKFQIQPSIWVA